MGEFKDNCYHEAAHAVFFHRAKLEIREVYVYEEGKTRIDRPTKPLPQQAMSIAAGCLAGPYSWYVLHGEEVQPVPFNDFAYSGDDADAMAEMIGAIGMDVDPEDIRGINPAVLADDFSEALEMLKISENFCGGLERCYIVACETASHRLNTWWPEIHAVAEGLMNNRHLNGPECVALIKNARSHT